MVGQRMENAARAPAPRPDTTLRRPWLVPHAPARSALTPDVDAEVSALRDKRMSALRMHYLVVGKGSSGSLSIPAHFSLQSALMELRDAELELDAMHARTESTETSLVRTQEDAFAYAALSATHAG
ncbi:hypothetical protein MSPP1_001312 [Malassezia sp. CBS 17886]|nr:hypothetical protein MSPP1_001312 [Malassezia sp. CBS 17886]